MLHPKDNKHHPNMFLCIGDIHIKPTNTHLIDALERQILAQIDRMDQVPEIVLLGDILDTFERVHTQALNRAYTLIDTLRKKTRVFVLVGNHDLINNQQFLTDQHWMNALKQWDNVHVIDTVYAHPEIPVMFVPYVPPQRFRIALETHPDTDWREMKCIFAHQEFRGAKMGSIVSECGDPWNLEYPMVISGHIHERQTPQANVYYPGASIQNAFGDQSTPIMAVASFGRPQDWPVLEIIGRPQDPIITEIPLLLPRKKTLYMDIGGAEELELEKLQKLTQNGEQSIRIVLKSDYEQFKVFMKSTRYQKLTEEYKCKIVHAVETPEKVSESGQKDNENRHGFDEILSDKVLHAKDEYLYAAYLDIVHGSKVDPNEVLIV